jgi:hypothetical protein
VRRERPGLRSRRAARVADHDRCRVERGASGAHEVVDDGCRERERLVLGARRSGWRWCHRELRRDRGPRGIRVAPPEVHATEARAAARPHERADLDPALVDDDGEVGHVGGEPRQVRARCDDPRADEHGDSDVGGIRGRCADRAVPEPDEERRQLGDDVRVAGERDPGTGRLSRFACERRFQPLEQGVDLGGGRSERGADGPQRRRRRPGGECAEHPELGWAGIRQHRDGPNAAELQFARRAPDEGECGIQSRRHAGSMPQPGGTRRAPSTGPPAGSGGAVAGLLVVG